MKKMILFLLVFCLSFSLFSYTVRILKNVDGSISIIHPIFKSKKDTESMENFLNRVFNKANPNNLEYEDIDSSKIPTERANRKFWKKDPGKIIEIDQVKKNLHEAEKQLKQDKKNSLKTKLNLSDDDLELLGIIDK